MAAYAIMITSTKILRSCKLHPSKYVSKISILFGICHTHTHIQHKIIHQCTVGNNTHTLYDSHAHVQCTYILGVMKRSNGLRRYLPSKQ